MGYKNQTKTEDREDKGKGRNEEEEDEEEVVKLPKKRGRSVEKDAGPPKKRSKQEHSSNEEDEEEEAVKLPQKRSRSNEKDIGPPKKRSKREHSSNEEDDDDGENAFYTNWSMLDRVLERPDTCVDLVEKLLRRVQLNYMHFLPASVMIDFYQTLDFVRKHLESCDDGVNTPHTILIKYIFLVLVDLEPYIGEMVRKDILKHYTDPFYVDFVELFFKCISVKMQSLRDSEFSIANIQSLIFEVVVQLSIWWKTKDVKDMEANCTMPNEVSERSTGCNIGINPDLEEEIIDEDEIENAIDYEAIGIDGSGSGAGENDDEEDSEVQTGKGKAGGKKGLNPKGKQALMSLEEALMKMPSFHHNVHN